MIEKLLDTLEKLLPLWLVLLIFSFVFVIYLYIKHTKEYKKDLKCKFDVVDRTAISIMRDYERMCKEKEEFERNSKKLYDFVYLQIIFEEENSKKNKTKKDEIEIKRIQKEISKKKMELYPEIQLSMFFKQKIN